MELQDFIEKFAEAIEVEDVNTLSGNTEFRSLDEWSSLATLSVIAMLDEEYDIQIENVEFRELKTIEDIFNCVKSKQ